MTLDGTSACVLLRLWGGGICSGQGANPTLNWKRFIENKNNEIARYGGVDTCYTDCGRLAA